MTISKAIYLALFTISIFHTAQMLAQVLSQVLLSDHLCIERVLTDFVRLLRISWVAHQGINLIRRQIRNLIRQSSVHYALRCHQVVTFIFTTTLLVVNSINMHNSLINLELFSRCFGLLLTGNESSLFCESLVRHGPYWCLRQHLFTLAIDIDNRFSRI